uniref:Putative secreted protein n=1 Tax=Amblyomma triste TaxID=251400 RepID=A0A023G5M1_AMBTT
MNGIYYLVLGFCLVASKAGTTSRKQKQEPIGYGVYFQALIYYDETVKKDEYEKECKTDQREDCSNEGFVEIFRKVQSYFINNSVMIQAYVTNVTQNDSLAVKFKEEDALNGPRTLDKLKVFAQSLEVNNNTVLFFFTTRQVYREKTNDADTPSQINDIATQGAFCSSTDRSAAVVTCLPGGSCVEYTSEAMAHIFNATNYKTFSSRDMQSMNATFQRCYRRTYPTTQVN